MNKLKLLLIGLLATTATQQMQAIDLKSFFVAALMLGSVKAEPTVQPSLSPYAINTTQPTQSPTQVPSEDISNRRPARCPNCVRNNENRPTIITGIRIMNQMQQEQGSR